MIVKSRLTKQQLIDYPHDSLLQLMQMFKIFEQSLLTRSETKSQATQATKKLSLASRPNKKSPPRETVFHDPV